MNAPSRALLRARVAFVVAAVICAGAPAARAKVTKIVIDSRAALGATYETLVGRAFGELDPDDPLNAIIQDIQLGKDADGKVHYIASFQIAKPVDLTKASGLLWHDVPNRGGRLTIVQAERDFGDIGLSSAWQGDNSGGTLVPADAASPTPVAKPSTNEWLVVPVARNPDGSTVTGRILARIVNHAGTNSAPLLVQANPLPYRPATLDTAQAVLTSRVHESMNGVVTGERTIASADWAWAKCDATHPFPGTPDSTQICLRGGFDPNLLYEVVFTAKDPLVLGVGFAAFRDLESFLKFDTSAQNPVAGAVKFSISRGVSQSGNFLRGFLHLGFNQDEARRQVSDGTWPIIAGRRIALNFRWAQPDGVLELYEAGSEGPQWWADYEDRVRGLPRRGILDRCRATGTCPKVIEHFGAAEVWELKLPIEWVGTDAKRDIPIPTNVRRYYIPSTTHGGGGGGFTETPTAPARCPGNTYGGPPDANGAIPPALLAANPVPHTETVNAIRVHFRDWVMNGTLPPQSVYPTLRGLRVEGEDGDDERDEGKDDRDNNQGEGREGHFLVEPTLEAMGFPRGIPGLPAKVPEAAILTSRDGVPLARPIVEVPFINPVLDYDWGPLFNPSDGSGVPTNFPPPVKQVIKTLVPRVDADGNELGGVPVVLRDAPLGSYFGWNVTVAGFHKDQNCDYVGGVVPFARTRAARLANHDPRLSLEERYGTHAGYVKAVDAAAAKAMAAGFLLLEDAEKLHGQADASAVLR
ncbi:MAG: alpha/beta hydrolase domain-containing protein [Myxococcales bacterium]